jgi:hypothetical protein
MADAKEKTIALISSTSVNLNQAQDTEIDLFTVPAGKTLVPVMIIMRAFTAGVSNSVVTFGETGVAGTVEEFLGDQTLTNVSGTGDFLIIQPVTTATSPKAEFFTAGMKFGMEITTDEGGALTSTVDVFGYLY